MWFFRPIAIYWYYKSFVDIDCTEAWVVAVGFGGHWHWLCPRLPAAMAIYYAQFCLITSTITPWSWCCFNPLTTTTATTPSTPCTRIGTAPPWMANLDAISSLMPNFALNAASSPAYLQCMNHVLQPHLSTVLRFRATQASLSGMVPAPVTHWKTTWLLLASAIEMTVAAGKGSSRQRRRLPRIQASSTVKEVKVKESPSARRASSYGFN